MIYKFSAGYRLKAKPQVVGEYLDKLEKTTGRLDSKILLEDARSPESPVHSEFEWDDASAAERYRDSQAQYVLRSVVAVMVNQNGEEKIVRAFVNLGPGTGHTQIENVIASPKLTQQLLEQALKDLRRWREKYNDYKELAYLTSAIERIARPYEEKLDQFTMEQAHNRLATSVKVQASA